MDVVLMAVAVVFAVVNGANDGAAIVATSLRTPWLPPTWAGLLLGVSVAVVPLTAGTAIAVTLAERLVSFEQQGGRHALALAVVVAMVVVGFSVALELPTSLTLALVGGIVGAGLGAGLPVAWSTLAVVLLVAAASVAVGGLAAYLLTRAVLRFSGLVPRAGTIGLLHVAGFVGMCLAYGANDGQKMLAVFGIALGTGFGRVSHPGVTEMLLIAVLFLVGVLAGAGRGGKTLARRILLVRPLQAAFAELAASASVVGSALVGAPVSMTQSLTGALVGAGVGRAPRAVRWAVARRIGVAWVVTLPSSFVLAYLVGVLVARS